MAGKARLEKWVFNVVTRHVHLMVVRQRVHESDANRMVFGNLDIEAIGLEDTST